jgi:APA family basic amino acid/polyamine antiporter
MTPARPGIDQNSGLVRAVGTLGLAAGIVNVTIGGGIFRVPSAPDVVGNLGAAAPLAYLVCAIVMGLIVICIAEAGSRVSLTGGPYAYVETAFGPLAGFMVGMLVMVAGTSAMAAVATIFADNVARFAPLAGGRWGTLVLLTVVLAGLAAVNIRGVRQGARLNIVSTLVKLAPLVVLAVAGLFAIDPAHLRWQESPTVPAMARASIFLIFVFAGIESALLPSGEVKDPARTVPRAVFLGMATVTLLYIVLQFVALGTLGPALLGSATPLADAAGRVLGGWGATLLTFGVVLSTFGYLSGMLLAMPRALYAFACAGILPRAVASVHPRYHTPHIAIVAQVVIILLLVAGNTFESLVIVANVATLLVYLGCAAAAWQLRRLDVRQGGVPFRVPFTAVAPALAIAVIGLLLTSVTVGEWLVLGVVLAVALALYAGTSGSRRAAASAHAAAAD